VHAKKTRQVYIQAPKNWSQFSTSFFKCFWKDPKESIMRFWNSIEVMLEKKWNLMCGCEDKKKHIGILGTPELVPNFTLIPRFTKYMKNVLESFEYYIR
jgi:hypothetical protein